MDKDSIMDVTIIMVEKQELNRRIRNLEKFICSEKFEDINSCQVGLIYAQLSIYQALLETLEARIKVINNKDLYV